MRQWDELDHIKPISQGGTDDRDNLVGLCEAHHAAKTRREQGGEASFGDDVVPTDIPKSAIPLTIVCGPPGSGKTTYCEAKAKRSDVVIDLDKILEGMTGQARVADKLPWLRQALAERNDRLRQLSESKARHAWFIVSAPDAKEREHWESMLGAESVVVMETDMATCVERINQDRERVKAADIRVVRVWWARYERRSGEVIVRGGAGQKSGAI